MRSREREVCEGRKWGRPRPVREINGKQPAGRQQRAPARGCGSEPRLKRAGGSGAERRCGETRWAAGGGESREPAGRPRLRSSAGFVFKNADSARALSGEGRGKESSPWAQQPTCFQRAPCTAGCTHSDVRTHVYGSTASALSTCSLSLLWLISLPAPRAVTHNKNNSADPSPPPRGNLVQAPRASQTAILFQETERERSSSGSSCEGAVPSTTCPRRLRTYLSQPGAAFEPPAPASPRSGAARPLAALGRDDGLRRMRTL